MYSEEITIPRNIKREPDVINKNSQIMYIILEFLIFENSNLPNKLPRKIAAIPKRNSVTNTGWYIKWYCNDKTVPENKRTINNRVKKELYVIILLCKILE
ncbi:MAG: hypothetical protein SVR08_09615 [Spirochaetota bacterium]|nr:hypothetical protein [Spirochaetota bacterium]